ncbi:hypothetical protein PZ897_01970 [Hoeflea sp. YIM 152468]|uniref:hypothetical protein n=1 Tax=Hoeflea sp. YIM 152468 TaxID=3031759 RepID=UPI0023DA5CA7|nr:hypothetical protein [Hoeflea sp. YIM 152468]MDF1606937.1 hypothetical protein [Hoeflea sp. YIM 152468]
MGIEDQILQAYLQKSHDKGGGWQMAMRMMASRMLVLEDRLLRAGVDFPIDSTFANRSHNHAHVERYDSIN